MVDMQTQHLFTFNIKIEWETRMKVEKKIMEWTFINNMTLDESTL
jgi:hypothetical protein